MSVTYSTGAAPGIGTLTLTAAAGGYSDSGSYAVTVTPSSPAAPIVDVSMNPGPRYDRSVCPTVGAGKAAYVQCGDLVTTHSMPAYRTLGRDRRLTLLHNSSTAHPVIPVMANISLPVGGSTPDSVRVILTIGPTATWTCWFTNQGLTPGGAPRRIALGVDGYVAGFGTGVYPYTLRVANLYGGTTYETSTTGEVAVVNRTASTFGAGWTLAGLDRLYPGQRNGAVLLVEADASTAIYESIGTNLWRAPAGAYRDTLFYGSVSDGGITPGNYYWRRLQDGTRILYSPAGLQRWVIDRTGEKTEYSWYDPNAPTSNLAYIRIAPYAADKRFIFSYDNNNNLQFVNDPGLRYLVTSVVNNELVKLYLQHAPDTVWYAYANTKVNHRTSALGGDEWYGYHDYTNSLRDASLALAADQTRPYLSFTPQIVVGLAHNGRGVPADTALAYLKVDGPRADVADTAAFWVNAFGAPTRIRDPLGHSTTIAYDSTSMPLLATRVVRPNGRVERMTYDARARLAAAVAPTSDGGVDSVRYAYADANTPDKPTSINAPADGTNRDVSGFSYDAYGRLGLATDPRGHRTIFAYDTVFPRLVASVTEAAVAPHGDLTTRFTYNSLGNLETTTSPAGRASRLAYDGYGNVTMAVNPGSDTTWFSYDFRNLTTKIAQRFGTQLSRDSMVYDAEGSLVERLDPRNVVRRWAFDKLGRDTAMTDEFGRTERRRYDLAGNVLTIRDRQGDSITTTYDALNRPLRRALAKVRVEAGEPYPDLITTGPGFTEPVAVGDTVAPGDTIDFDYDALGNPTYVKNRYSTVTRVYGTDGSLQSETQSLNLDGPTFSRTYAYTYNHAGQRQTLTTPSRSYTYSYGAGGSLLGIAFDTVALGFEVDSLGRRTRITYPNGTRVRYRFDVDGLLSEVADTNKFNTPGIDLGFLSYDGAGRLKTLQDNIGLGVTQWTYDTRGQLASQNGPGVLRYYQYDEARNRSIDYLLDDTVRAVLVSGSNRLASQIHRASPTASDTTKYTYDWNGNVIREHYQDLTKYWPNSRYYDAAGQLTWTVTTRPVYPPGAHQKVPIKYYYDGLGRRVGSAITPGVSPNWTFYDGNNVIEQKGAEVIGDGSVDNPLVIFAPIAQTNCPGGGSHGYFVTNGGGRLLEFQGEGGEDCFDTTLWAAYATDAGAIRESFGYGLSRARDTTDLSYFRNRYYDSKSGRFTQEDPIGFAGGMNLYAYAGNNPASYTDPFGLCPPKDMSEVFSCVGQMLAPIQGPLEVAGAIVTAPLGGELGMGARGAGSLGAPAARVIGHYPAYLQVGEAIGGKVFNVPSGLWKLMPERMQWALNRGFLDRGIKEGAEFVMGTLRSEVRSGSALENEINYILKHGYRWADDAKSLIPK
ncbi:MAG TPA: RHS repeat-associated core domain-containing protein [Longimicrobiales bacterium]|nr:RHS repeat-associated core domain-containing protein [Longimicrobiales bacterium]